MIYEPEPLYKSAALISNIAAMFSSSRKIKNIAAALVKIYASPRCSVNYKCVSFTMLAAAANKETVNFLCKRLVRGIYNAYAMMHEA